MAWSSHVYFKHITLYKCSSLFEKHYLGRALYLHSTYLLLAIIPRVLQRRKGSTVQIQEKFPFLCKPFVETANKVVTEDTFKEMEEFTSKMYAQRKIKSVNEAPLIIFSECYKSKNEKKPVPKSFLSFDSFYILPCSTKLKRQVKRAAFLEQHWSNGSFIFRSRWSSRRWLANGGRKICPSLAKTRNGSRNRVGILSGRT